MKIEEISAPGWHKIVHITDGETGLDSIVSVHDATLGPACGGCRVFPYQSFEAGLEDVKNLSRGMTYKNALGGIPFGGGKAIVFADPKKDKSTAMLKALGRAIDTLEGLYYTAEDSGMSEADIQTIREETSYAAGMANNGVGGNPSPFTARGVWRGIQAAVRHKFNTDDLTGKSVSILGVGAVGMALAEHLHGSGAKLIVADVNKNSVREAIDRFGAVEVAPAQAHAADVDIFAPCALGGSINADTVHDIKASIIAGAANNQLKTPDMDQILKSKDILYAPDYVINAAGVISVGLEILGEWSHDDLNQRIDKIGDTLTSIFERAQREDRPTGSVADQLAMEVISKP